ncbi:MAG TPA: adenylate/guanylate cyclase domain-containing protein [Stenotrophobium sp.]|jgi:hypothetical protein|nr:adenylate/guanylate cyclase domain-containing protein [Stenotrophobium sp.]
MNRSQFCAILFVDLAGSTALYERLGDAAAKKLVDAALDLAAKAARAQQGEIVKTIGDELMLRFPDASRAAAAAVAMLLDNHAIRSPFQLHVGFHAGPVIAENGDIFGDAVNTAARLTQMAHNGQILTSEETLAQLTQEQRSASRPFDIDTLRGRSQATRIIEILWEPGVEITRMPGSDTTRQHAAIDISKSLRISVRQQDRIFRPEDTPITVGRESLCMLMIASAFASRVHARIEYRRGKFVLQDQSSNGTYVTADGANEVFLKNESLPMMRRGIISLGAPLLHQTGEVMRYDVE